MKTAPLILLLSAMFSARSETVLQADRVADVLILNQVYLNEQGPYRMMVDTGNSSSILRPAVAERLGLRPAYAVETETAAGVKRVAVATLDTVRVGSVQDNKTEVMLMDVKFPGVDGVLGQSWLVRHDYLLDYRNRRLVVDTAAPPAGIQASLRSSDGRPQVSAEVDGRHQELVVDSGTSVLVLFGRASSMKQVRLVTNAGSVEAATGSARVTIDGRLHKRLTAVQVDTPPRPGLLPPSAFRSVYISNRDGIVVFVP